ncbi:MAG TPA: hypothetical protein DGG95_12990 [Cytophagales bacterium]|jgi:hypothetical protein|nr:hypothetical protein [Cytophagales bacterium]
MTVVQSYESLFNKYLDPFKAMLVYKKRSLSDDEWLSLVERIKNSIIQNPEQYLGRELPDHATIEETVSEIFTSFIKNQKT